MISCDKAAHICNKSQYREASLKERWQLWLHILVCKTCASFSHRNKRLTKLCDNASLKVLSPEEKAAMKKRLNQS
jgi:hypothetical protein